MLDEILLHGTFKMGIPRVQPFQPDCNFLVDGNLIAKRKIYFTGMIEYCKWLLL